MNEKFRGHGNYMLGVPDVGEQIMGCYISHYACKALDEPNYCLHPTMTGQLHCVEPC